MVLETKKFAETESEANKIAVAEEMVCHERAPNRVVYLNIVANTIRRLRSKSVCDAAKELMEKDPMFKSSEQSSSSYSGSLLSEQKGHPINPNLKQQTHFMALASGGQRGSWSIEKRRKMSDDEIEKSIKGN